MCQLHNIKDTAKLRRRMKNGKKIFWKVYRITGQSLYPPCYDDFGGIGHPGIIKAEPEKDFLDLEDMSYIKEGAIHVFSDKIEANDFMLYTTEIVIPVICREKDLISCGSFGILGSSAAFKQIEILEKDFPKFTDKIE